MSMSGIISRSGVPRMRDMMTTRPSSAPTDEEEPADDLGHHRIDVELRTRLLHEFRGAAKVGLGPDQHDHAVALAAADDGIPTRALHRAPCPRPSTRR